MDNSWNDSELARLSADLDDELTAIFDQVESVLRPEDDQVDDEWAEKPEANSEAGPAGGTEADEPDAGSIPAIAPADLLAEDYYLSEDLDIDVTLENEPPFPSSAATEADWLEPGLLGEPETAVIFTPDMLKELSRMIEAAVEKGVTAALAKMRD